eukprot:12432320-Alexandrium_andersonii.AAC.1
MPMCSFPETASRGVEAKVVRVSDGGLVPAVGHDKTVAEPAFAMPVVREGSVARLAGPVSRAEAGARVCATSGPADDAVRRYLDPGEVQMTFGKCKDPGVGDRLGPG